MFALKGLGGFLLAGLAVCLTWAAFNNAWVDAAPKPVPAPLRLAAPTLSAQNNIFFAYLGLDDAGPAAAAGQARWAALVRGEKPEHTHKPWDSLPPWRCGQGVSVCAEQWASQVAPLAEQLQAEAERGERCADLAAVGLAFEEPVQEAMAALSIFALVDLPLHISVSGCARWLLASAVVAAEQGRDAESLARLAQADRLLRLHLVGSHSLVSHAVAWGLARSHWQTIATLVARHPAWATQHADALALLLQPLPEQALSARRWIAAEAAYGRKTLSALGDACTQQAVPGVPMSVGERVQGCVMQFGFMPEATLQAGDQQWLALLAQHDQNAQQAPLRPRFKRPIADADWRWRNTVGHSLVTVSQAGWNGYAAQQADVALLRQAAVLAVQLAVIPRGARSAWLETQPIDPVLRERIRLSDDGDLLARSWRDKTAPTEVRLPLAPA